MSNKINNENSPGSINTIGQKGHNRIGKERVENIPWYKSWWMTDIGYPFIIAIITIIITMIFQNKKNIPDKKNQNTNSPGSINTIDQVGNNTLIINPKEPPRIIESRFVSSGAYQNGYKTQFILVIGNASQNITMDVKTSVDSGVSFLEKNIQNSGTRTYEGGTIPYTSFLVSLFTNQKLSSQDFTFSVKQKL